MKATDCAQPTKPFPPFLASEDRLNRFVGDWEDCTLAAADWTHAAHIAVAAFYAFDRTPLRTYQAMRLGLLRFNEAVGGKNTNTSGYHESLTRFWSFLVWKLLHERLPADRLTAARLAVAELEPKRTIVEDYYGFNVRDAVECRLNWVAPSREFEAEMEQSGALADLKEIEPDMPFQAPSLE